MTSATTPQRLETADLITNEGAERAGFSWEYGEVQYRPDPSESTKQSLGQAPHMRVKDVEKFEANFPGVILQALDGTSVLVGSQAVTRRRLKAVKAGSPKPTDPELRTLVVLAMRGIKNRGGVVIRDNWLALDGTSHKTQAEAVEYSITKLVEKGIPEAIAREAVESAIAEQAPAAVEDEEGEEQE